MNLLKTISPAWLNRMSEEILDIESYVKEKISEAFIKDNDTYTKEEVSGAIQNHPEFIKAHISRVNLINARIHEETTRLAEERNSRRVYGRNIFLFVAFYMVSVLIIILCDHAWTDKLKIAILTSANINVIGLLMAVVRYLFPKNKK